LNGMRTKRLITRSPAAALVALGTAALLIASLVATPALAAKKPGTDSRSAYFGSLPFPAGDGKLTMSPATVVPGGYVEFTATFQNLGGQTLTRPTFGIGTGIAYEADGVTQALLPAGVSLVDATPSTGACQFEQADGAECTLANIAGGSSASVIVTLRVGTSASSAATGVKASWKVAEQVNDNGANRDTWWASGGWFLDDGCDNLAESKIPGGQSVKFDVNQCGAALQASSTDVAASAYTSGVLKHVTSGPRCRPGGGAECFGDYTSISVGAESFVVWTITWDASLLPSTFKFSKAGVLHFPDSGPAVKIDHACTTASEVDCWTDFGFNSDGTKLSITFRTLENGFGKGYG